MNQEALLSTTEVLDETLLEIHRTFGHGRVVKLLAGFNQFARAMPIPVDF
ncbi:MAG: hypothetical protein U1E13_03280 [Methylophilaceae bacterium]|nr:hypothetical protein [Methylophilaceae bacterium]